MTVANVPDRYGECADCDSPQGEMICRACAEEERIIEVQEWLLRQKTVYPGLTNVEIAIVERLLRDLGAET